MNIRPILPYTLEELESWNITSETILDLPQVEKEIWANPIYTMKEDPSRDDIIFQTGAVILSNKLEILTRTGGATGGSSIIMTGSWQKSPLQVAREKLKKGDQLSNMPRLGQHFCIWFWNSGTFALQIGYILGGGRYEFDQGQKRTKKPELRWEDPESLLEENYITGIDRLILEKLYQ